MASKTAVKLSFQFNIQLFRNFRQTYFLLINLILEFSGLYFYAIKLGFINTIFRAYFLKHNESIKLPKTDLMTSQDRDKHDKTAMF